MLAALLGAGLLAASARGAAPSNTAPPTITGTAQQGRTLIARNGTWTNSPSTFFYRWQRCSVDGTGCANIDNAAQRTYTLKANDVDQTVRVVVTASNGDGQTSANSAATDVISSNAAPRNTANPTVSGDPQVGEELTAAHGTWTGGVRSYAYQWKRCDRTGAACTDAAGATGSTYGVRVTDVGHTLRVAVTATNLAGSATAASAATGVAHAAPSAVPPKPAVNHRPRIAILFARFVGARVYVKFRVCDDSRRNLGIRERDSKRGVASYSRRFRTLTPPRSCAALSRTWRPAPRFRHGRFVVTLWARDFAGLRSAPTARAFSR
jgi:hypothetical protein